MKFPMVIIMFEGSQYRKKWLVSPADLESMYIHFKGKKYIPLWCNGKESGTDSCDERPRKKQKKSKDKDTHTKEVSEQEEEPESVKSMEASGLAPSIGYGQGLLCLECMTVTVSPLMHLCSQEVFKSNQKSHLLMHLQVLPL